jgi:integrase
VLSYPKDDEVKTLPYTPGERDRIISAAWLEPDPVIRIIVLICAYSGSRIAEIAEADVRDVTHEDGIPVFHIRTRFRTGEMETVKTPQSIRRFTLHSAIRDEVLRHVANRPAEGPLFNLPVYADGRSNTAASNRISRWLDANVEISDRDQKMPTHSFRHYVASYFEARVDEGKMSRRLADYLTGHAVPDVKSKKYIHWSAQKISAQIETLPSPPSG